MSRKGAEVTIPLKLQLDSDEAIKDLKKFANDTKADISGFSSAKKILDDLEKSINKAFDGKNADKFSAKILKIEQAASGAASKLLRMGDEYKAVWERQQTRTQWAGREDELQSKISEFARQRQELLKESEKLEPLVTKGIVDEDYYTRMAQGAREARTQLQHLNEEKIKLEQSGGKGSDEWKRITEAMTSARRAIGGYNSQMKRAMDPKAQEEARIRYEQIGKELTELATKSKEYTDIVRTLSSESRDAGFLQNWERLVAIIKSAELEVENFKRGQSGVGKLDGGMTNTTRGFYLMRTIIRDISKTMDSLRSKIRNFISGILEAVKHMARLNKESRSTTRGLRDGFKHALSNVLRYGFGIRSLFFLFRRLRKYAKEALDEMAKTFPEVNNQMSRAVTALNQMKGAIGTAIQPLLTVVVPVLEKIAALISKIMSLIGGVFATLTGQGKIYQAVATQTDYAASLEKTGAAAKKAKKELEGYLSPIDEINKYQSKKDDDTDSGSGGGASGPGFKYVETPISDFAKKIADIINKLLAPIKKAWEDMGDIVVASWKRAWNSIKTLLADIGRDFLTMWNQEATVEMFRDIFRILADIGDIVYFLTKNFDEAWNKNKVGLHILENIRDILAIIIDHIENMTSATVEWAKNLDFSPLLEAMNKWLESLKPVVDAIAGVFEDFYTQVLLPLSKWAIEKGLPELLGVFEDFNNKVDWEGLRSKLSELWDHLEPFAERVGEGLILFIDDISEKLADFLNSETFDKLIDKMGEFMDSITAEDVESALWGIVKALIALEGLSKVASILGNVAIAIKDIAMIVKNWSAITTVLTAIGTAIGYIATFVAGIAGAALAVYEFFKMWEEGWNVISTILEAIGIAIATVAVIILAPIEGIGIAIAAAVAAIIFAISQLSIIIHDNWDAIVTWCTDMWQKIKDMWNTGVETLKNFFIGLWNSITSVWNKAVNWVKTKIVDPLIAINEALKTRINAIFEGLWIIIKAIWIVVSSWFYQNVIEPLIKKWEAFRDKLTEIWNKVRDKVTEIWTAVKDWLFTNIIDPLVAKWEAFRDKLAEIWNAVSDKIHEIWDAVYSWLEEHIITPLQEAWETCTTAIAGFFTDLWDGIKRGVVEAVNWMISKLENGINGIIDVVNGFFGLFNHVVTWAAEITGEDWAGIEPISHVSIPRLAQGAVIPPNKEFMAVLGDQKSGTNIETPLSTMVEAFNQALRSSDVGGVKQINFILPDRRTLAQYTIAGGRIIQTSTGKNPFELA